MRAKYSFEKRGKNIKKLYVLLFISTLFIILPVVARANPNKYSEKNNMFYIQVLNKSIPLAKVTVFDEENLAENSFSVKRELLKLFSIKPEEPLTILGKEMAFIDRNEVYNTDYKLHPFKLDEKYVLKEEKVVTKELNKKIHNPSLKKRLDKSKPEVFIYHTHATESYKPEENFSLDLNKTVCAVGDILTKELEDNYGISVIHDKTVHDANAYAMSYERSGVTVDKYLKKYGDFKLVIDLHRDGLDNPKAVTTNINGENVAKIMFVLAQKNPHYKENLKVANSLSEISNKLFPGFYRSHHYYGYGTKYFHQNKSNNSVLIEVGANSNNLQDAKNSAKYLARIIGEYINGK
ncbi:stage II sporulation protein P [Clostridium tetani]|uniref:stage II sporulation protein P n=1 Tax=Clostridium tetani TaxID=1513 RepID=UPI000513E082|nr:stage II sporulation protein P [Clostridium tetani]KGI44738.1 stage II sporulation protein P [Clostridium tetani]RXI73805.1 stage II sporulation protein P [Clostridium tetani]BDR76259.1 stage II sporulation protein P [Clostridium tetani]BDR87374.1 stage II sporulation protein P [Clostridium tetani]